MSINSVCLTGNLTRDPELAATPNGTSVLRLGLAVNDRVKNNQTEEWEDRPNFIDCTMFGARAESVSRFLKKGSKVSILGRLHWSQWEDKNGGGKRSKLDVTISEIEFMSASNAQNNATPNTSPQTTQTQPQSAPQATQTQMQGMPEPVIVTPSIYDEDIPF